MQEIEATKLALTNCMKTSQGYPEASKFMQTPQSAAPFSPAPEIRESCAKPPREPEEEKFFDAEEGCGDPDGMVPPPDSPIHSMSGDTSELAAEVLQKHTSGVGGQVPD